jgi:hypothetical protein
MPLAQPMTHPDGRRGASPPREPSVPRRGPPAAACRGAAPRRRFAFAEA